LMSQINAGILQPIDYYGHAQRGFERGQQRRDEWEMRKAVGALQSGDPSALGKIYAINPQLGAQLEDQMFQRSERERAAAARGAQSELLLQALGGQSPPQGGMPMPRAPGVAPANNPAPPPMSVANPVEAEAQSGPMSAPMMDPSRDAQERAIRADPDGFLTFQGNRLDITKKDLDVFRTLNDAAMQLLGGVHDQGSYNRARMQAARLYQQHGKSLADLNLPDQYSPELVEELRLRGMSTDKQMMAIARENRLDWDIEDDIADNERADENQQSLDAYRRGSLANTRRGQDLTDRRGRRGQDVTDKRVRDSAAFRGEGGKSKGGKADLVGPVHSNAKGQRVQFSKSKNAYVDLATGAVVK
jgi:hypothetical protein